MKKKESWFKPHILNPHNIEKFVQQSSPGVYVLGDLDQNMKVKIKQIRASREVKADLKKNLGKSQVFMYKPLKHQLDAFAKTQQTLQLA